MDGALIGRGWPVVMVTYGSGGPVNADDWDKEDKIKEIRRTS